MIASWNEDSTGGGMSAVIAIYNGHNGVFGPLGSVLVEGNRIENKSGAFYCLYTGQRDADNTGNTGPTGMVVKDNLFIAADSYAGIGCTGNSVAYPDWVGGGINRWESNTNEDGEIVPEPPPN